MNADPWRCAARLEVAFDSMSERARSRAKRVTAGEVGIVFIVGSHRAGPWRSQWPDGVPRKVNASRLDLDLFSSSSRSAASDALDSCSSFFSAALIERQTESATRGAGCNRLGLFFMRSPPDSVAQSCRDLSRCPDESQTTPAPPAN